ncbi:DUF58 domain-containing protein [Paenibacillus polysaccharolyticus]|uniref:DUF58 domain-containing protein n=1 Tax=Paenibacillus polysaccharolyticus TaxID=582692 RepID=UPI00280BDDAB|nr:DUF58 domain-containing protein [Paenibacillus polysaccharolyticus]
MRGFRGSIAHMLMAVLLGGLYFWHGGKSALFLATVSVLVVVYGILLRVFGPRQIVINRHLRQGQITAGESIRVRVELQMKCPLPLLWLMVCDNTPGGIHRKLLFPGLKRRWSYQYEITGLTRGVHVWQEGRVYWGDIFGWSRAYATIKGEEPVVVVPDTGNATTSIWPEVWTDHGEGVGVQHPLQGIPGTEIREYQQGDSFNRIHWKSSARSGKLHTLIPDMLQSTSLAIMVYEEYSGYEGLGVGERSQKSQEVFERAVLGAASWVREATDAQTPCELWLSGDELASKQDMPLEEDARHEAQTNRSRNDAGGSRSVHGQQANSLDHALRRLAYARLHQEQGSIGEQLGVDRLEHLPYGSSILVFTGQLDERLVAWLEYASALGFQARVYLTMNGQMRGTAGDGKEQSGASAVLSPPVVEANRSQVWTERLVSKGVKIVYQESIGTVGSWHGGKAGIVDVGA